MAGCWISKGNFSWNKRSKNLAMGYRNLFIQWVSATHNTKIPFKGNPGFNTSWAQMKEREISKRTSLHTPTDSC